MQPPASTTSPTVQDWIGRQLSHYSLLDAFKKRRSRRFGMGMKIEAGPFIYASQHPNQPLTEDEEAALAFAACGITGYALADLAYGQGQGGHMLDGLIGRTISSPDAINAVSIVVTNDEATYLLKRPQDFPYSEIPALIELSQQGKLTELYQRMRVKISEGRVTVPVQPGYNFNINKWSVYAPGSSYFLPINDLTVSYINALLEAFDPTMGLYILDERNLFQPAGIAKFAKSHGGHLDDDADGNRILTVQGLEASLAEAVAVEQGMALQNLGLMTELLGLGGFSNYARNEFGWFEALGFRMQSMLSSDYVGAGWVLTLLLRLMGKDFPFPYAVGLERNQQVLLHGYCPPYYPSMKVAVESFVTSKFGSNGIYRKGAETSAWQSPEKVSSHIEPPSQVAIDATCAYCDYIFKRYGRFPAYSAPFRTVIAYQATHVDTDFYKQFFKPEALSQTQLEHIEIHPPAK
ncbi:MAG TPA: hypothetical protein VKQ72_00880 [Aggregatilineales bacterium]|nr:hypothetical protein [Aggregatilineales bacterium]